MSHSSFPSKSLQSGRGDKTFGGNSEVVNQGRFELRAPENDVDTHALGTQRRVEGLWVQWSEDTSQPELELGRREAPGSAG